MIAHISNETIKSSFELNFFKNIFQRPLNETVTTDDSI